MVEPLDRPPPQLLPRSSSIRRSSKRHERRTRRLELRLGVTTLVLDEHEEEGEFRGVVVDGGDGGFGEVAEAVEGLKAVEEGRVGEAEGVEGVPDRRGGGGTVGKRRGRGWREERSEGGDEDVVAFSRRVFEILLLPLLPSLQVILPPLQRLRRHLLPLLRRFLRCDLLPDPIHHVPRQLYMCRLEGVKRFAVLRPKLVELRLPSYEDDLGDEVVVPTDAVVR